MALAETAVLAVELKLAGASQFKAGISEADAAAAGLGKSVAATSQAVTSTGSVFSQFGGKMGFIKQAAVSTGAAISGMASHFKSVITGPLGLIGLGAGLFTVAGAIKSGIDEAQSFGLEVQKLAALTGQSVEATSAMAAALDHFGISGDAAIKTVGMLTKNIGMIVNAKGGTQKFFTEYGLQLRDTHGNLVSVNEEILRTADYFNNKNIPATEKAAGIAKLYGRSWQALIPFLQAGRKGITEAEQAAQDLGLTLTAQNVGDLKTYRESFLKLGDAVKGAELQIGLVLMPALSGLATSVTNFLAHGGRQTLVTFFQNALQTAKDFGAFVSGTVIPTIKGLASAALGLWNSIPAPLRDILAKGFIADRTIHFLFGVSPLNLAKNLLGDLIGPVLGRLGGSLFQRGGTPATPLFVADVTGGLGGGAGGAAGGLGGLVSSVLKLAIPVIGGLAVAAGWKTLFQDPGLTAQANANLQLGLNSRVNSNLSLADRQTQLAAAKEGLRQLTNGGIFQPVLDQLYGSQIDATRKLVQILQDGVDSAAATAKGAFGPGIGEGRPSAGGKKSPHSAGSQPKMEQNRGAMADALANAEVAKARKAAAAANASEEAIMKIRAAGSPFGGPNKAGVFQATAKLDPSQVTDLRNAAKTTDIEALRGAIGTKLAAAEIAARDTKSAVSSGTSNISRATSSGDSRIVGAIIGNRPITNVTVNVSATSVQQKTTVVTRYGPTGGTRNTLPGYNTNHGH